MSQCSNCEKSITKKCPGLECHNCGNIVHANQTCAGLPAKELAALKGAVNLNWSCGKCRRSTPRRRSYIVPEDDGDEDSTDTDINSNVDFVEAKTLIKEMTQELKKVFKLEIANLEGTLKLFGTKLDDYGKSMEVINSKIIDLEKKNTFITNRNNHLEARIRHLEEYVQISEQNKLNNKVEVAGIPQKDNENLKAISISLAKKLKVGDSNIKSVKRLHSYNDKNGLIHVELDNPYQAQDWIRCAKQQIIYAHNIIKGYPRDQEPSPTIIVRRALTKTNKSLLWTAQQKLKPSFKYVWFQNGKVLARKSDTEKPIAIHKEDDIKNIITA